MEVAMSRLCTIYVQLNNEAPYSNKTGVLSSSVAGGKGGSFPPPRNPGKFAKDGEQTRPQPAIRIDSSRKL